MTFSLVIPCYNEAKNLPLLVKRCLTLCQDPDFEVIFVNNGSTDNSAEVLTTLLAGYTQLRQVKVIVNQGYGFGILAGLKECTGNMIGWTHADMQTDPLDALQVKDLCQKFGGNIFVKGKRYGRALGDRFFTIGMSIFESILLKKPLWDINAQPTMFPRQFLEEWDNPPSDFSLDLYAYYMALINKLPVYRFAVKFGERAHGMSHWNINWKAKYKFIKRTITFSYQLKKELRNL